MKNTIQKAKLNHIASIKLPSLLSNSDTQTTCNISVSSTATKQPGTNEHFRSIQFYTSHFFGKLPWGKGINRFKIEEYYCRPDTKIALFAFDHQKLSFSSNLKYQLKEETGNIEIIFVNVRARMNTRCSQKMRL